MIQIENGKKIYNAHGVKTEAIHDMSFVIPDGQFVAIMGPSGSGKSTLLNVLGGMDVLTSGALYIDGQNMAERKPDEADAFRKAKLCFIFQNFALMEAYTVAENVELPLLAQNIKKSERKKIVEEKLALLGIDDLAEKRADAISGGQQQRVAIARALASEADIILADEPTGALDSQNSKMLMEILQEIHQSSRPHKTIVMVTHDRQMAEYADRVLHIQDGRIVRDEQLRQPDAPGAENQLSGKEEQKAVEAEGAAGEINDDEAKKGKKLSRWVKVCIFLVLLLCAGTGYCLHKFEWEYSEQPMKHLERIDSAETDVTMPAGGGPEGAPCDMMHLHLTGEVLEGEITIEVYDMPEAEITRTSDGVVVCKAGEDAGLLFSKTYHAGDTIDHWLDIQAEEGFIHCECGIIVSYPTNTDIDAYFTYGNSGFYYGWQNLVYSNRIPWLRKLLHISEEEVH